jgi:acetoin utilization deacetylase AcuC-like enzyme
MIKVAFSNTYLYQLPEGHRFPISKYELIKDQLLYEGIIREDQLFDPGLIDREIILAHSPDYYRRVMQYNLTPPELRKLGIPLHPKSVGRALNSVAGTLEAAKNAGPDGLGINIGGGYHHAFYDHGEGFCIFNDLAVTSKYLIKNQLAEKICIIDLDVHQGNGTAEILREDPDIFTLSIHGRNNYPLLKEKSDLDVALDDYTSDREYLRVLDRSLEILLNRFSPDFILYQSGVDVLSSDKLGRLSLTPAGCSARDQRIIKLAGHLKATLVITLGGGYSNDVNTTVKAHINTIRLALEHLN